MTYQTIYPYNGKLLRKYPNATDNDVENTLETAHALYLKWRKQSISLRKNILLKIAEEMRHSRDQLAKDIVYDMGKLLTEAKDEVDLCINIIDYYANHAEKLLQPINLNVPQGKAYYLKQATGVIMAVVFHFTKLFASLHFAPNFMVGNPMILKDASNCPTSAQNFADLVLKVGAP